MPFEIERKFLIDHALLDRLHAGVRIVQGYLPTEESCAVRSRIKGDKGYLTLKGDSIGLVRPEFEYEIPVAEARQIIDELCRGVVIDKTRYEHTENGHTWEIDVFHGDNDGLVVAELELASESEQVDLPEWIRQEVTEDARYYNSQLVRQPFRTWSATR